MAQFKDESVRRELAQTPLLRNLSPRELELVFGAGQLVLIRKNGVLFSQGDPAQFTSIVVSGRIKLQQSNADGEQTLVRVLGTGGILAIVSALDVAQYPATAVAERDTEVLSWEGKELDRLFLEVPMLCRNALGILSARVREMQERFAELANERTERRLARALLRLASQVGRKQSGDIVLDLALSRQDLAEMIGTTLFSVSRILSEWQEKGWVRIGRQNVTLTDPKGLVAFAEDS